MENRGISRFWEFDQGGAWVIEEPSDVAFEDVGWLLDFTNSPETINGVVPVFFFLAHYIRQGKTRGPAHPGQFGGLLCAVGPMVHRYILGRVDSFDQREQ